MLILLEFLDILLSFSKIFLSFLSRLLEFFQKLLFWWKYWRNITNLCVFCATLTVVVSILVEKYHKTSLITLKSVSFFEEKKCHVLKNSRSLRFLTKLVLSFWPKGKKFRFFSP